MDQFIVQLTIQNPQNASFAIRNDNGKQKILTFKKQPFDISFLENWPKWLIHFQNCLFLTN